jgi:threonine aldolase
LQTRGVIDFRSDNTHGASPEILAALARAAAGTTASYGEDPLTSSVRDRCREIFETDCDVVPVLTGTAGNALAIAAMTPPWGAVFCHEDAHVHRDEMAAPEFFSGGAKLIPIAGAHGKLVPDVVARAIRHVAGEGRAAVPACVSITQATEAGTVYTVAEVADLVSVARAHRCRVHMDGARFANAVAATTVPPAELTWRAGVDVLVFGGTKNGALAAEMLVVFDRTLTAELELRRHRAGHRLSKMRFVSAQLDAYLANDLWLRNARHANAMAAKLAKTLDAEILRPVDANAVFARFAPEVAERLREQGFLFYDWPPFGAGAVRLVTGFSTTEADVDALVSAVREATQLA